MWVLSCFICVCYPMDCSLPGSSVHEVPGKNTGTGCLSLLQGIFPTQGSDIDLLHWKKTPYHLSHQGSPMPYSRFSLVVYFMLSINSVYTSVLISQFRHPPSPLVYTCLFSTSVSLFLLSSWDHLYHFQIIRIYIKKIIWKVILDIYFQIKKKLLIYIHWIY